MPVVARMIVAVVAMLFANRSLQVLFSEKLLKQAASCSWIARFFV